MTLGVMVDIAVSVLAVMILFTLAATAINEIIADNILRLRGRTLAQGIRSILESRHLAALTERHNAQRADAAVTVGPDGAPARQADVEAVMRWALARFYDDPAIRALSEKNGKPSAIEPRRYAETLLTLLGRRDELAAAVEADLKQHQARTLDAIRGVAAALGGGAQGQALAAQADAAFEAAIAGVGAATTRLDRAIEAAETEFTETMDRVSGWYLRRTRLVSFCVGLVLCAGANIDLLDHARRLSADADLRARSAAFAQLVAAEDGLEALKDRTLDRSGDATVRDVSASLYAGLQAQEITIGWACVSPRRADERLLAAPLVCEPGQGLRPPTLSRVMGWLLIAAGVTLGAQFWFDLLRSVSGLRTAGRTGGGKALRDAA